MNSKPRLLIADDDPLSINASRLVLKNDFEISVAVTVKEAVSMLDFSREKVISERFSVAIIDLSFRGTEKGPGTQGFEVLRSAIEDPYLEPIIFTGTGDQLKASEAMKYGAFQYIIKSSRMNHEGHSSKLKEAALRAVDVRKNLIELVSTLAVLRREAGSNDTIASHLYRAEQILRSIMAARGRSVSATNSTTSHRDA